MIEVETLHHVSISVTDLARARQFYGELLGLKEISRPPFDFPGAWYQLGDRQLHLLVHPGTRTLRGTTTIDSREGHYGIRVRSYRQTLEHLETRGIRYRDKPRNLTPWPQIYVTDPDGNVIEFNAERLD
ncbi:MAG TPA: VOC family protein [Gemmatimonadales bacterium]|nr:VOC family protein [Gemmatimonadales bacterium]